MTVTTAARWARAHKKTTAALGVGALLVAGGLAQDPKEPDRAGVRVEQPAAAPTTARPPAVVPTTVAPPPRVAAPTARPTTAPSRPAPKPSPKPTRKATTRPAAPPPAPPPPARNCDPSYPGVCIPPAPPDLNCPDVEYVDFRVVGGDPHGFDRDNDGIGCES